MGTIAINKMEKMLKGKRVAIKQLPVRHEPNRKRENANIPVINKDQKSVIP